MMSSQVAALAAARAILDSRLACAPQDLVPRHEDERWSPNELRQRVLTKGVEPTELARLELLVAADAVRRPEPSAAGKPWSGRYAHAMIQHFNLAAWQAGRAEEEAALVAASAALSTILHGSKAGLARLNAIKLERQDFAWVVTLGLPESQFMGHVNILASFHKQALANRAAPPKQLRSVPPTKLDVGSSRPTPDLGVGPQVTSERIEALSSHRASKPAAVLRRRAADCPTWLVAGPFDAATMPSSSACWLPADYRNTDSESYDLERLNGQVLAAWEAFADRGIREMDRLLEPLYASFGSAWGPISGPDGQMFWNWIRLVRLASAANDPAYGTRRLAAVSAVELLVRSDQGVGRYADLIDELTQIAMDGLPPTTNRPLSGYFATCAARLLVAIGHSALFDELEYSNQDKARAREVWAQEYPSIRLTGRDSSVDFAMALEKAYREFRYRATEAANNHQLSDRFIELISRSMELLDLAEQSIAQDAVTVLSDTLTVARAVTAVPVPTLKELDDSLATLCDEVATSGSLLLQETLALALRGGRAVLSGEVARASRISHPEVTAELLSTQLPLSAQTSKPFRVTVRLRNSGNSAARDGWMSMSAETLSFDPPTTMFRDLEPSEEQEFQFLATVVASGTTAILSASLSWSDDLCQEFSGTEHWIAEDQGASSWTRYDANPYSLSSIGDPKRLVGRGSELASLEGILRMSDSTYVSGLKRVGKSSLVRTLVETLRNEPGWAASRLELGTMLGGSRTPAAIALGILDGIADALLDAGYEPPSVESLPNPEDYARVAGRWFRALDRAVPELRACHVVVSIDDFDSIPTEFVDGEAGAGLFLFLRSLVDKPWLSLIFIGSEIMPTVIASQGYQLNQVRRTPLDHFRSTEDTARLLRVPASDRLEWSQPSIEFLHQMSNGNPYYSTLFAQRVWDALRELDRRLVEPSDVQDAAVYLANNEGAITFSHMWADDPSGMAPKSRRAMLSAALLLSIARCMPNALSTVPVTEAMTVAQGIVGDATTEDLKPVMQRLRAREIVTLRDEADTVAIRVPLFAEWLKSRGRRELEAEFEQFSRVGGTKRVIAAADFVALAGSLNYAGREVNEMQMRAWVEQFSEDTRDQYLALLLLQRLVKEGYYSSRKIYQTILPKMRDDIKQHIPEIELSKGNYLSNVIIVNHGVHGSSVPATVTNLHQVLRVKKENCLPPDEVPRLAARHRRPIIVMVDDFVGTGQQLIRAAESLCTLMDQNGDWRDDAILLIGSAIAATKDLTSSPSFEGLDVRVAIGQTVSSRLRGLDPNAQIFESEADRLRAEDLVTTIGRSLNRNRPTGWGDQGLLVVLESNCPNNTLPVFWQSGNYAGQPWRALFPRVI